jgi:hypothetical protein
MTRISLKRERTLRIRTAILAAYLAAVFSPLAYTEVKLSNSGICHNEQSPWYAKTKNYTPFPDLSSCLQAGGRLPKATTNPAQSSTYQPQIQQSQLAGTGAKPSGRKYNRAEFGDGWLDLDGDCQDSRAEALIAASTIPVKFKSGCKVASGRWISPFTNNVIMDASAIDIDHLVPLSWSWKHGAQSWTRDQREAFANDPINLWPVEKELNRQKGDAGPEEWLPPAGRCQYVARFKRITIKYRLQLTPREDAWINNYLATCKS